MSRQCVGSAAEVLTQLLEEPGHLRGRVPADARGLHGGRGGLRILATVAVSGGGTAPAAKVRQAAVSHAQLLAHLALVRPEKNITTNTGHPPVRVQVSRQRTPTLALVHAHASGQTHTRILACIHFFRHSLCTCVWLPLLEHGRSSASGIVLLEANAAEVAHGHRSGGRATAERVRVGALMRVTR